MAGACGDLSALVQGGSTGCPLKVPPPGHVLSPWVRVQFLISGKMITVGNQSSPDINNHAMIKDFEMSQSNGVSCRVTIVDEQGSDFENFMKDVVNDAACITPPTTTNMIIEFGWAIASCQSGDTALKCPSPYLVQGRSIEANFTGGKYMFIIEGQDVGHPMSSEHKEEKIRSKKMYLTDAIKDMLIGHRSTPSTTSSPSVAEVRFQRWKADGSGLEDITWADGDPQKGPKAGNQGWVSAATNRLTAALQWLAPTLTDRGRGVTARYDPTVVGGAIVFFEDGPPTCGDTDRSTNCLGSYIVNGGQDSPVIEFNPKVRWNFGQLADSGGGMGVNSVLANPGGGKNPGYNMCPTLQRAKLAGWGTLMTVGASDRVKDTDGSNAASKIIIGQGQQIKANYRLNFASSLEADLTIVGDPSYDPILMWQGRVEILVLNPYYIIEGAGVNGAPDWLAQPVCNEVLSNKGWRIKKMNHLIRDGKYTTTLTLFLAVPGVDIDVGQPFGGDPDGWVPPAQC